MDPMRLFELHNSTNIPATRRLLFALLLLSSILLPPCFAVEVNIPISNNNNHQGPASTTAFQFPNQKPIMRAWTCHGRNQKQLVENLSQAMIIQSPAVRNVMCQVDRINYSPANSNPYQDAPQVLGWGQTISAPHMHAHALEEMYPYLKRQLESHPSDPLKILDVGCGSGYLTACFGRWISPKKPEPEEPQMNNNEPVFPPIAGSEDEEQQQHQVYGIDIHQQLVQVATDNMKRQDGDLLEDHVVQLQTANGWEGLPDAGPFDAIHVGASAADFPTDLAQQLKPGGVMVVPVGPQTGAQYLYRVERLAGAAAEEKKEEGSSATTTTTPAFNPKDFEVTRLLGVRYVPLVKGKVAP